MLQILPRNQWLPLLSIRAGGIVCRLDVGLRLCGRTSILSRSISDVAIHHTVSLPTLVSTQLLLFRLASELLARCPASTACSANSVRLVMQMLLESSARDR